MDYKSPPNGLAPQGNARTAQPSTVGRKMRAPTIYEALPYTPLSSIIPFTPDIIPAPIALPTLSPTLLSSSNEARHATQILEQLSHGATSAETASKLVQRTLQDVRKLLDPESRTQFTFTRRTPITVNPGSGSTPQVQSPALNPFAKMVLENANVPYRYLTPESEPDTRKSTNGVIPGSHMHNVEATAVKGYTTPQHQPTSSSQQRKVEAVIPAALSASQRIEYQHMPDATSSATRGLNSDQRQKADMAVQNLQNLLGLIFQTEDRLHSDAHQPLAAASSVFTSREIDGIPTTTLSSDTQAKLESFVAKVTGYGRLADLDLDELMRVQGICESAVGVVEKLSLRIAEGWSDEDAREWVSRLDVAESGLLAARTLMRIMTAGAQFKELQSEDYLFGLLASLKAVVERCIIPVIEEPPLSGEKIRGEKAQPPPNPKFVLAESNRKAMVSLMNVTSKGVRLLGDLLVKIDLDDRSISGVEYLCKTLIFAENANTEKESAVGIQNFEALRRCAMDVLAKIFTKYTDQRQFIFDEILLSLEKLPATKQSARQYRLADAKPIQLVSALLMRLVQTSATKSNEALKLRSRVHDDEDDDDADADADSEDEESSSDEHEEESKVSPSKGHGKGENVDAIARPLHEAARTNAWYIVKVLTRRAANTLKTSEEPFRKLLDIFTEDFLNVLGSSDWPAAEILLRTLTMHMIQIVEADKSTAPSRILALELLGTMGSGILELHATTSSTARGTDTNESRVAHHLSDMVQQLDEGQTDPFDLLALAGPYRYVIQYLEARNTGEDAQLQTARGYHLMEWAFSATSGREGSVDSEASDNPRASKDLLAKLKQMFAQPKWLDDQRDSPPLTTQEGRLAAMIVTLNSPFCRAFDRIFKTLLNSMNSEQSRVKSRSMASVVTLLEKDPGILDRNQSVLGYIFRGATDSSPLVRESALNLIDKCLTLRPELDASVYTRIIERTRDASLGVRKRALKMLKEMYLRNKSHDMRSIIADAIVSRIEDAEESVIESARTTIEEIWFQPLHGFKLDGERAIESKLALASQAALFIQTVQNNEGLLQALEALLKRLLHISKAAKINAKVCKMLVATLFDGIVDSSELPGSPPQDQILLSLTIFARVSPTLFTTSQLERLEPYTQNLTNTDDLDVYRSVITILRNVMPHQPMMNTNTLKQLQTTLLTSVTRLQKSELREVAPCLWTIDSMLGDQGNKDRLPNFIISVLQKIHQLRGGDTTLDEKTAATLAKLMRIVGEFGNACNFDTHFSDFQKRCAWSRGDSVAGIIVETLCPFTSPKRPLVIRLAAMEAICTVSQAWPKQFLRSDVTNAFEMVFRDKLPELEEVLLSGLEGFFVAQEVPDENGDSPELGSGMSTGTERLGKTYVASDHDGASTALAQRFLSQFLRLALASCDESAFIASRLVISINKQGLVHPKESAPALVALETCPNKNVAAEAFREHKSQFQKHESLFEKEYMRAVQQTFEYQQSVIGDPAGYSGSPPVSKMHLMWEVLKMGKTQIRKKFLGNVAQKLDFDPAKLDATGAGSQHLSLVRFCLDNLAFFEYDKVDDLLHLTSSLEKIFAGTGSTVAQAIESEVLQLRVDNFMASDNSAMNITSETLAPEPVQPSLDPRRLLQLAVSSQILCLIWETRSCLHRLWNLQKHTATKSKQQGKDTNKSASRSTNASYLTESYLKRSSEILLPITSGEAARSMCGAFVELISVDHEVKVGAGSDDDAEGELLDGYGTPSESTDRKSPSMPPSGGSRGRKRKPSIANGTPRKRARPSLGKRRSTSGRVVEDDDEDEEVDGWD